MPPRARGRPETARRKKSPPCDTPGTNKSYRLNGWEVQDVAYLLEVWGTNDPALTENGVIRRAIQTAAALERGRRTR